MLIAYDSLTGNVERFVEKTGFDKIKIFPSLTVQESFILVTYTIGFGEIPQTTINFLIGNQKRFVAVAVSGNKNWGSNYGKAGDLISKIYKVPLLLTFELSGTEQDILCFKEGVSKIAELNIHRAK